MYYEPLGPTGDATCGGVRYTQGQGSCVAARGPSANFAALLNLSIAKAPPASRQHGTDVGEECVGRPGVRGACSRLRLRASGARTTSHRAHRPSPHKVKVCRVASRGCLVHEHGSSGPFARRAGGRDGSLHRLGSEASAPSEWGEQKFSSRLQGPFRGSVDCDPGVAYVA